MDKPTSEVEITQENRRNLYFKFSKLGELHRREELYNRTFFENLKRKENFKKLKET